MCARVRECVCVCEHAFVHIHRGQKTVLNLSEPDLPVLVRLLACYMGAGTQTLVLMIIQQVLLTTELSRQFKETIKKITS